MMKFIASTEEAAKAKARRAFGDAVYILSMRHLPSGDVEISASDKPGPAMPAERREPSFGDAPRRVMDETGHRPSTGARLNEPIESKFSAEALSRLSGDLTGGRNRRAPSSASRYGAGYGGRDHDDDDAARDPLFAEISALLKPHGIKGQLLTAIADGAARATIDDDLYRLQEGFDAAFDVAPFRFAGSAPIMLVGPTGAGKTSCSAKLAALAMHREGAAFMMTADIGRAGAIDQIKTYGEQLGADYVVTETPRDVSDALRAAKPRGAIILDSPGVSPYDTGDLAALRSFQEACNAEPVLVLPAGGDADEYLDWAAHFADFGVRRMIVTKFDATRRVGAALTAAYAGRMALACFSETPFISEGLLDASAEYLARRFLSSEPGRLGSMG